MSANFLLEHIPELESLRTKLYEFAQVLGRNSSDRVFPAIITELRPLGVDISFVSGAHLTSQK